MKHIQTKFALAMALIAALVLTFTGAILMVNITVDYKNDFYVKVSKAVANMQSAETADDLYKHIDNMYDGSFYILQNGTVVKSSVSGGIVTLTDNLRALSEGRSVGQVDAFSPILDFGAAAENGLCVYFVDTKSDLHSKLSTLLWQLLQALAFGILFAVVLSFIISKKITRSIRLLKQGAERMAEGDFSPISVSADDEIGALCQSFNTMGQQIQKDYDAFEAEERARRDFIANVSHELKTPLTVIKSYSQTLADMQVDFDTQKSFLSIIDNEVDRMNSAVSQLLQLSHLEAHKPCDSLQDIDLCALCKEITDSLSMQINQKNIALRLLGDANVYASKSNVHTIVKNIIENAVKYTNIGGSIDITVDGCVLCVKNTGEGIQKEDMPHIFERFYRADKAHSRKLGGTGLGLAIAKECANTIGAVIECESVPMQYTIFKVTFDDRKTN